MMLAEMLAFIRNMIAPVAYHGYQSFRAIERFGHMISGVPES